MCSACGRYYFLQGEDPPFLANSDPKNIEFGIELESSIKRSLLWSKPLETGRFVLHIAHCTRAAQEPRAEHRMNFSASLGPSQKAKLRFESVLRFSKNKVVNQWLFLQSSKTSSWIHRQLPIMYFEVSTGHWPIFLPKHRKHLYYITLVMFPVDKINSPYVVSYSTVLVVSVFSNLSYSTST